MAANKGKSVRVNTLDLIFSKCIRERNNWICEYDNCDKCGNESFENYPGGLHNSHFRGRRGRGTRWLPDNCFSLCMKRHERMGDCPEEHAAWVRSELGDTRYDALILRANGHMKYTPHERWEMNKHYLSELSRMRRLRMDGEMGYIELIGWD